MENQNGAFGDAPSPLSANQSDQVVDSQPSLVSQIQNNLPPMPAPVDQVMPPAVGQIKYAGFWIRYAASFIDGLVLFIPSSIINFGLALAIASIGLEENIGLRLLLSLPGYIVMWVYYVFMTHKFQATLGKKAVGIKVYSEKGQSLTFGQIVIRETVGKIVSSIILFIGYIMAGFTERKRSLHDMIAGTVVVYDDPTQKTPWWIFVIALVLPMIAIIGIFASIVLVSLNNARGQAQEAALKSSLNAIIVDADIYLNDKGTLVGFQPDESQLAFLKECNGQPIINVAQDGKRLAVFIRSCDEADSFYCRDTLSPQPEVVNDNYATSGESSCAVDDSRPAAGRPLSAVDAASQDGDERNVALTLDEMIPPRIVLMADDLTEYKQKNKTYKGFVADDFDLTYVQQLGCATAMKLDIAPDGSEYVIHHPLCSDPGQSYCYEDTMQDTDLADTALVQKTYHCR